jgi:hypothetical protein
MSASRARAPREGRARIIRNPSWYTMNLLLGWLRCKRACAHGVAIAALVGIGLDWLP